MEYSKYYSSFNNALENKKNIVRRVDREIDGIMIFHSRKKQLKKTFSSVPYTIIGLSNNNGLTAWELHVCQVCALQVNTLQ